MLFAKEEQTLGGVQTLDASTAEHVRDFLLLFEHAEQRLIVGDERDFVLLFVHLLAGLALGSAYKWFFVHSSNE